MQRSRSTLLFGIVFLLVYAYVVYRACVISFTHDEALTYTLLTGDWMMLHNANNHPLNSLLAKLSSLLFGYGEPALRLPNVLAFGVYGYFTYRLILLLRSPIAVGVAFGLLICNPFVLDFFSLCRGYGLGMAAALAAWVFFLEEKHRWAWFAALLAVYANYTFLYLYLALAATFVTSSYFQSRSFTFRVWLRSLAPTLIGLLPALAHMIILKTKKQLYFGGDNNIFADTIDSMLGAIRYNQPASGWLFWGITIVLVGTLVVSWVRSWKRPDSKLWVASVVIGMILLIPTVLNLIMGIRFPVQRGSLVYLISLIVFVAVFISEATASKKGYSYWMHAAWLALPVALTIRWALGFQTFFTATWTYDAYTKQALERIDEDRNTRMGIVLETHWLFQPAVRYYQETHYTQWLKPGHRIESYTSKADYYYLFDQEVATLETPVDTVHAFRLTQSRVLRSKASL